MSVSKKRQVRRLRFSTRSVLIFTGIIALLVWQLERLDRPRRVIDSIEKIGGSVTFQDQAKSSGSAESWLRRFLPRSYFDEIKVVSLIDIKVDEKIVSQLPTLGPIEFLDFHSAKVQDIDLRSLTNLRSIYMIEFGLTEIGDETIEYLTKIPSLRNLYFDGESFSNAGILKLGNIKSLERLNLQNVEIDDVTKRQLQLELPNCEIRF